MDHNPHEEKSDRDDNDAQSTQGQEQGLFQCNLCKKIYNRADHLIRHVRSHTRERPFGCDICGKGFGRKDLLKRHKLNHEDTDTSPAEGGANKKRKTATNAITAQSGRVAQACKACASSKLKCSEGKPCERCKKKNLVCEDASPDVGPWPPDDHPHSNGFHTGDGPFPPITGPENEVSKGTHSAVSDQNASQTTIHRSESVVATGVLELNGSYFSEFLRHVVPEPWSSYPAARPGAPTNLNSAFFPQHYIDLGTDDKEYTWNSDLWYSDGLQDTFNLPFESTFTPYASTTSSNSENTTSAGVGADAFKGSLIRTWTPQPGDTSMMERQNLVAPENVDNMPVFPESRGTLPEPLSYNARDRILGMVLETCPYSVASRVIASFPSAEFLNNCIQYYLCRRHGEQIDSYIHLPTFKPNDQRAELLAMLAGAGAVATSSDVVRKLGYALQESVRQATARRFDENNVASRELGMLQTVWLQNEVGLWSDSRRKIEIAEACTQFNATVLRRGGRFKRSMYQAIEVREEDSGEILDKKWLQWAEQECMKRIQYHAFLHDARVSLTLHVSPTISYAELHLPMPAAKELWAAADAEQWKKAYLARHSAPVPRVVSLTEALQDMSSITHCRAQIDVQYSALILLHGLWSLVWEYRQLSSIGGVQSKYWNGLVLSSRHAELCSALQQFRLDSLKWGVLCPRVRLDLELISMHLHMSLEELQLYAGKEDIEEAQQAYNSARRWFDSPSSRQAIWHAGQVLKAAASFSPGSLFDSFVIAVYHASMALWSFGVVGKSDGLPPPSLMMGAHAQQGPFISLDQEETLDLPGFVAQARGLPGLTGKDGRFIPLEDTDAVMEHVADLLSSNWKSGSQPLLVDNVRKLMLDLGKAAKHTSAEM